MDSNDYPERRVHRIHPVDPYGRPVGQVGDREGQRQVLLAGLEILEKARKPGEIRHLPFAWPDEPKKTDWQPPEMSPIIKAHLDEIKQARKREAENKA